MAFVTDKKEWDDWERENERIARDYWARAAAHHKTSRATPQWRNGKKPQPKDASGWKACVKFVKASRHHRGQAQQLLRIIRCSQLMHGFEAEVNWYTGGNSYVTLPTAVAEAVPGVYLAKARFRLSKEAARDKGPETPVASISHLRLLGTQKEFVKLAAECTGTLGKPQRGRLVQMLQQGDDSMSDAESV